MKWRLRPDHLFPLALLACLFAFVSTHPIRPHDFWWHLAAGQQVVQTGTIPSADTHSYTAPGAPYPSYQVYWLAEALLYLAYAAGGPALNILAHAVLVTGTYALLLLLCRRLGADWRLATACALLAAALGFENWNLRPQALSYLFGVVYLWLIYHERRGHAGRYGMALFPLVMVVWVNCHGSFPLGLLLIGFWLLEGLICYRRDRELPFGSVAVPAVALLTALAALWFNPQHLGIIEYLRQMQANPVVQSLPEWAPASLATKDGVAFFILLPLSALALLWAARTRGAAVQPFHVLSLLFFALLALKTGRAIVWFGLAVPPILAEVLGCLTARKAPVPAAETSPSPADRVMVPLLAALFLGLAVASLPWLKSHLPLPPHKAPLLSLETPVRSTQWLLDQSPPPRLFHHMAYGSYLIWAAPGRYQVFADPRIELYPPEVWRDYETLSRGQPGWQSLVTRYGIQTMMLDTLQQDGLVQAALASGQWQETARFGATAILTPTAPPGRGGLAPEPGKAVSAHDAG